MKPLDHAYSTLPDDTYQDTLNNTKAVVFLDSPHGEADAALWSRMGQE